MQANLFDTCTSWWPGPQKLAHKKPIICSCLSISVNPICASVSRCSQYIWLRAPSIQYTIHIDLPFACNVSLLRRAALRMEMWRGSRVGPSMRRTTAWTGTCPTGASAFVRLPVLLCPHLFKIPDHSLIALQAGHDALCDTSNVAGVFLTTPCVNTCDQKYVLEARANELELTPKQCTGQWELLLGTCAKSHRVMESFGLAAHLCHGFVQHQSPAAQ